MASIFRTPTHMQERWPYWFRGELQVMSLAGGTPTHSGVAEQWIKSMFNTTDDLVREAVAEIMVERGVTADEAVKEVAENRSLVGFKRDSDGLYYEGRCLKACLKESARITWPDRKWGPGKFAKGTKGWFPEHVFVVEDHLPLGVAEPHGVSQGFVSTPFGRAIKYNEYVEDVKIPFTLVTDHEFGDKDWAALWLCAEMQGVGANRAQGFGRFEVTAFDPIDPIAERKRSTRRALDDYKR